MDKEFKAARQQLVDYFQSQLIGPANGVTELLKDAPHKRYLMGTLFPLAACRDETDDTAEENSTTEALSNDFKPSSMSVSFFVEAHASIEIDISAGRYTKAQSNEWRREPLSINIPIEISNNGLIKNEIFNGQGRMDVKTRKFENSKIVTVAFSNNIHSGDVLRPKDCLYQAGIVVRIVKGNFKEYPSSDRFKLDEEQKELALTYRKRIPWAVGHGVAVDWNCDGINPPSEVRTASMPVHEVKGFTTELDSKQSESLGANALSICRIADETAASNSELLDGYLLLVDIYREWIDGLDSELLNERYIEAKNRVIARLRHNADRMDNGIERLRNNDQAMTAFRLANRAMLMQMIHSGTAYAGKAKPRDFGYQEPDYFSPEIQNNFNWRPFQLAFQLLTLESLIPDEQGNFSETHNDVDLLWFPTGGGKTEAYLAVAAWEMIYRRLTLGADGGGTAVIKRYTLRLLTAQQFQRAGSLICALEVLRRENSHLLCTETFSLGLWVGAGSAPNSYKDARKSFETARNSDQPENPFQLQNCPWCGTSIFPLRHSEDNRDYGVRCDKLSYFEFFCPSNSCEFHSHLPIQVVDDALYDHPPTLLIGTIDKFARLTWKAEAHTFFGKGTKRPPSLIIQDELHLISGPLGTIAGIYEAGFDTIMQLSGGLPKVIAATATIRSAQQQVNKLFGRKVNIFPPSGTDETDSFFSTEDHKKPGRLYVGVMPTGHTGQTGIVQTAAVMLQAPYQLGFEGLILDSYWTLPVYHNSRRELGKTMTMAQDDIPSRIKVIADESQGYRDIVTVEELSANVKGPRIPEVLAKVERSVQEDAVDVLPCTNMISVGVDISRLGMMLIAGQPKATSEYIQASSRVGRDNKRPPGIVVTQYSATKPRDRSHYENFKNYHQALYRYVEPTSVTPWAMPAVERALHAALISVVRVHGYLRENKSAKNFNKDSIEFKRIRGTFEQRLESAMDNIDEKERKQVFSYLDKLINDWQDRVSRREKPVNCYEASSGGHQFTPLFKHFDSEKHEEAWNTLNSMRNVDTETHILVRGEYND
jgi:hypothetical protein